MIFLTAPPRATPGGACGFYSDYNTNSYSNSNYYSYSNGKILQNCCNLRLLLHASGQQTRKITQ